ncbi:MAG TPA: hypothetical protein VH561_02995 [Micromonosporaceae bacterium]
MTFPTSAEQYTKQAIQAWAGNNSASLDQYEVTDGILHTMSDCGGCYNTQFGLAPGFCQGAAGSSYCLYFNIYGDKLMLRVENQLLGHPKAVVAGSTFEPTTFPSDDEAYATEALAAWNDGNDARLKLLTKDKVGSAYVDGLGAQRGSDWTYQQCDGGMGSLYCDFTRDGHTLAFQFVNGPAAPTTGPDSQHRIVSINYLP